MKTSTSITFRLDLTQREKLRQKAELLGKTESELIRDILGRELEEGPLSTFVGRLRGQLALDEKPKGWRKAIRSRNWRT